MNNEKGKWLTNYVQLLEFIKIQRISLEQDLAQIEIAMDLTDMNSDEYKDMDIEHIGMSARYVELTNLVKYAAELGLTDPVTKEYNFTL